MITPSKDALLNTITTDMRQAMKSSDHVTLNELRSLLARIHNAEAVPVEEIHDVTLTEVARKELSIGEIQSIIHDELTELQETLNSINASSDYAIELKQKIAAIQKYVYN